MDTHMYDVDSGQNNGKNHYNFRGLGMNPFVKF